MKECCEKFINLVEDIFSYDSIEEFLINISNFVRDGLKAERASLFIYDQEDNSLKSIVFQAKMEEKVTIPLDIPSIAGYTFKNKKPVIVDDVNDEDSLRSIDPSIRYHRFWKEIDQINPTKTMLSVPVSFKDEVLGVFVVVNKFPTFNNEDLMYIEDICRVIGIAFKNLDKQLQLQYLNQLNCKIMDVISDGIIVTDEKNRIKYINETFLQMTGFRYRIEDVLDYDIFETFPFFGKMKEKIQESIDSSIIQEVVVGILRVKVIPVKTNHLFEPKIKNIIYVIEH